MDCNTVEPEGEHGQCGAGGEVPVAQAKDLYAVLQTVQDGRCKRGRRFEAAAVLTAMLLAKLAGEQSWSGIAHWVRLRLSWLQGVLPLRAGPCANTYRYLCEHIDATELMVKVSSYVAAPGPAAVQESNVAPAAPTAPTAPTAPAVSPAPLRHLACDGKELRGTHRLAEPAQQALGIYDVAAERLEALLPIAGKGYEQAALKGWLEGRDLTGCLLTADALHTHAAVCKAIRRCGGHYLLIAKRNQPSLNDNIRFLFSQPPNFWFPEQQARTVDVGHGRLEVRSIRTSAELNDYLGDGWLDVAQVFQLERCTTRNVKGSSKTTTEVVCGITSLTPHRASAQHLLRLVRAHWRIENRNHWRRDATLAEDRTKMASKPAALVMAALNNIILALLDRCAVRNVRAALRTFAAQPAYALALLRSPT